MLNVHEQLIEEFYAGFATHDPETMLSCYHKDIIFKDPVFGTLHGDDVADMWRMLVERSRSTLQIEFSDIHANGEAGRALWTAKYVYPRTQRLVVNEVRANFTFQDDLIIGHTDHFDLYRWAKQALGFQGTLLGWAPFMQKKIRQKAVASLRSYQTKRG